MDDQFKYKRIYTAWDNIGDEKRFFTGIERLQKYGIKPYHITAYMLIGYDRRETWERIWYRFNKMIDLGVFPYPMVYDPLQQRKDLKRFQTYVVRRYYKIYSWEEYMDYVNFGRNKIARQKRREELSNENQMELAL
jgi:hypothetical protein